MVETAPIQVVACPRPFSSVQVRRTVVEGATIRHILDALALRGPHLHARVFIDDRLVPHAEWEYATPKAGQQVTVRVVPTGGGGGGKDILRVFAMIAVIAVAFWVTGGGAGAFLPEALGMGLASGTTAAAVAGGIIAIGGTLAVAALIPPPKPKLAALSGGAESAGTSPALSLTGVRNQFAPYGVIPQVLGTHRVFPPLAARPYTEIVGSDQYLHALFAFGYGPLVLQDFKIGETPLSQFTDVEMAILDNYNGSDAIPLFPSDVYEDALSVELTAAGSWQTRTSQANATQLSVDLSFPNGIVEFGLNGTSLSRTVELDIEYRAVGASVWLDAQQAATTASATTAFGGNTDLTFTAVVSGYAGNNLSVEYYTVADFASGAIQLTFLDSGNTRLACYLAPDVTAAQLRTVMNINVNAVLTTTLAPGSDGSGLLASANGVRTQLSGGVNATTAHVFTDNRATLLRYNRRWPVAAGQYEIRVRRITADASSATIRDQSYWTMLRTIQTGLAVRKQGVTLVAIRIKATDQLNGTLDEFNAVAKTLCLDWNGSSWITRTTNNPASLFRSVLQGQANARQIPVGRIDLPTLQSWHARCAAAGRTYSAVRDFRSTLFETLRDVATIGRASYTLRDGLHSVVEDLPQATPVQVFTPRNSWGFKATKLLADIPHAVRVRFVNASKGFQQDVRYVYNDGYNADGSNGLTAATRFEEMDMPGCTDPDLAYKLGRYHIAVATLRPEVFTLSADVENLVCTTGDRVDVSHDVPLLARGDGRVLSVTRNGGGNVVTLTLDSEQTMAVDGAYGLRIRKPDGSMVLVRVVTVVGTSATVTLTQPLVIPDVDILDALVTFGDVGSESVPMIVKSIEPGPDLAAQLTLVDYAPGVQTADTAAIPPYVSNISQPLVESALLGQPIITQIVSDESVLIRAADGTLQSRIVISLEFRSGYRLRATGVQVQYRETGSSGAWTDRWSALGTTQDVIIPGVRDGVAYDIRLRAENAGAVSDWTTQLAYVVVGKTSNPSTVTGFMVQVESYGVRLRWNANPELDVTTYEIRQGPSWTTAALVTRVAATAYTVTAPGAESVTYLIKAVDVVGNASTTAASAMVNLAPPLAVNPSSSFEGADFVLVWTANAGSFPIREYEIRYGSTFASATIVQRVQATAYRQPANWIGARTWWVVAIDVFGNQGDLSSTVGTVAPPITTSLSPTVIDNTVLLRWAATSGTLPIATYEIRRGAVFATADILGAKAATFNVILETIKGTKTYWVVPIDAAGNRGTELGLDVTVDSPPDFILRDTFLSDFFDARTNVQRVNPDRVSLRFNGVDDYVWVNPFGSGTYANFTTECWIKTTSTTNDGIIAYGVTGQGNEFLVAQPSAIQVYVKGTLYSTAVAVNDGAWHHLAVQWRNSDGTVTVYKDGVSAATTTAVQTSATLTGGGALAFGCDIDEASGVFSVNQHLAGDLDDVRVWSTFRTNTDVSSNMNTELIGTETGLLGYWRLNERRDAVANDVSNSDVDGDIIGAIWHVPVTAAIVPFYSAETVDDRRVAHGYTTPQAQITAGYPYVAQPVPTSATLTAYYDAGTVLPSTRLVVSANASVLVEGVSLTVQISVRKTTGASWTTLDAETDALGSDFRYVKVAYTWTSDGKGFGNYDVLETVLRAKLKSDSGTVTVTANPTAVTFVTEFLDVGSIIATPQGTAARYAVVNFTDVANPTGFDLYLFDASGAAVTGNVAWQARGN
jgi:hypothetical protein